MNDSRRVWVVSCANCGWQRTVETQAEAEALRDDHEGTKFGDEPRWHSAERRWEDVEAGEQ